MTDLSSRKKSTFNLVHRVCYTLWFCTKISNAVLQMGALDLAVPDKNSTCRSESCPHPEKISIDSPVIGIVPERVRLRIRVRRLVLYQVLETGEPDLARSRIKITYYYLRSYEILSQRLVSVFNVSFVWKNPAKQRIHWKQRPTLSISFCSEIATV